MAAHAAEMVALRPSEHAAEAVRTKAEAAHLQAEMARQSAAHAEFAREAAAAQPVETAAFVVARPLSWWQPLAPGGSASTDR